MHGILIYDDCRKMYTVESVIEYDDDHGFREETSIVTLYAGDTLLIKVKNKWYNATVKKVADDDVFGWYLDNHLGPMGALIGKQVIIEKEPDQIKRIEE